jgi:clan AA aspartic protease
VIVGSVNSYREAIIRLVVSGPLGQEQEIDAVVDTGFTGFLTLPLSLIATLNLPFRRRGRAVLADGSESLFDIYEARVLWDGQPRRVAIDAVDTDSLVGMALLSGYELTIQAVVGGRVSIKAIL